MLLPGSSVTDAVRLARQMQAVLATRLTDESTSDRDRHPRAWVQLAKHF